MKYKYAVEVFIDRRYAPPYWARYSFHMKKEEAEKSRKWFVRNGIEEQSIRVSEI